MRRLVSAAIAVILGVATAYAAPRAATPGKPSRKGATEGKKMTHAEAPVEMKLSGQRRGRPPQLKLEMDVVLRNTEAQARWFVLPKDLPNPIGRGGVDVVEAYGYGKDKVVVGRFLGSGGFQAVLVPAGGVVKLRRVPLSFWGDLPDKPLPVEVLIASDIKIGGEPAQKWFGSDPTSSKQAEGEGAELLGSHKSPDGKERPVVITEVRRATIELSLGN